MTKATNENKIPLTATMPSFAPSASKSHDKGAKREQNPPYSHYNGLNVRCSDLKYRSGGGGASCHQSRHYQKGMTTAKHSDERSHPRHLAVLTLLFLS